MGQLAEFSFPKSKSNVLLINTHAYDLRLPWSQWHQPTGLLQLGSVLTANDCDVKFIDCLHWDNTGKRIRRRKIDTLDYEGYKLDIWRFGARWTALNRYVEEIKRSDWIPDIIYLSCGQTTWWQAAKDIVEHLQEHWFPATPIILGGTYAILEPQHALNNTNADYVIQSVPQFGSEITSDLSLYPEEYRPHFAGINLYRNNDFIREGNIHHTIQLRPVTEILNEIKEKIALGIREITFFDEEISLNHKEHFHEVLKHVAPLDVRLIATGNITPEFIDESTAQLMYEAGYSQIHLRCDVQRINNEVEFTTKYDVYQACVDFLYAENRFKPRSGSVVAMLQVGNPYEQISQLTERLIKLASIVGSVILVQYQYPSGNSKYDRSDRELLSETDLTRLNCKLYPLGLATGNTFEDYVELTRLSALLNSKYRGQTFDFLGESLTATLLRESITNQGWKPSSNTSQINEIIPILPVNNK